jgi:hypothetical protein
MATFRDLQDRINLDYLNNMTLLPEVKRAIRNAIICYETRRFWFNETATALACVASQSYITVPTDMLILDRLEITIQGNEEPLWLTSFDCIRNMNMGGDTGEPTHFAYRGDRWELAAIPNSAYPIMAYYVHKYPALSADSDSNPWTNEGANLIAHAATLDLMMGVMQVADNKRIERHALAVRMAENELDTRNATRLYSGLRATQF